MARVSAVEGIRYGFNLFGFIMGVVVFGVLFLGVGIGLIAEGSPAVGVVLALVGLIVTYAGVTGTTYKVIADAVAKGNENASDVPTAEKVTDRDDAGSPGSARTASEGSDD